MEERRCPSMCRFQLIASAQEPGMCQGCVGNIFGSLGNLRLDPSRRQFFAAAVAATAIAPIVPALAASSDGADLLLEGYERVAAQAPCRASISLMYESMRDAEPY